MATFKVTLKTVDAGTKEYVTEGASFKEVAEFVKVKYQNDLGIETYTVEQIPVFNQANMNSLMNASFSLFACLILMVYAEYRVRKWLKN